MKDCGKILLGSLIGCASMFVIKMAYEYGRYSAVHEIYKRGWAVVMDHEENEQSDNITEQETES